MWVVFWELGTVLQMLRDIWQYIVLKESPVLLSKGWSKGVRHWAVVEGEARDLGRILISATL